MTKLILHLETTGTNASPIYKINSEMPGELVVINAARDGFLYDKESGRFFPWHRIMLIEESGN